MVTFRKVRTAGAAAIAAALGLWAGALRAEAGSVVAPTKAAAPAVSVMSGEDGAYRIEGSFRVGASAPVAWAVLTDYDNLSSFVSSMRASVATRDASGRLLVTQEAVGRAGPFARTLTVVLEVTEDAPARIAFRDLCAGSFHSYTGAWAITPEDDGVRVTYTLEARPRSSPPLFARSILASNARGLLEQVRLEMLRRGRTASAY
ncbi:MAG TPA: SRPBCC family protein [Gemmatimonadales bacterium]|jgi:carbon monoxide dehydrogenase subunit G|nr:SRPBCC family protein [Gemmatimonadales bacterium]